MGCYLQSHGEKFHFFSLMLRPIKTGVKAGGPRKTKLKGDSMIKVIMAAALTLASTLAFANPDPKYCGILKSMGGLESYTYGYIADGEGEPIINGDTQDPYKVVAKMQWNACYCLAGQAEVNEGFVFTKVTGLFECNTQKFIAGDD